MSKDQLINQKMFVAYDATSLVVSLTMLKHMQLSSPDWPLAPAFLCPGRKGGGGREEKSKVVKTFPADVQ